MGYMQMHFSTVSAETAAVLWGLWSDRVQLFGSEDHVRGTSG